jgi:HEAT repeat protein
LYALELLHFDQNRLEAELILLTRDDDSELRLDATESLRSIAHDKQIAYEPLVKLLEDPVAEVRRAALKALIAVAPPQVQDAAVKRLLKDPDESVRNAAEENLEFLQQRREAEESAS